VILTRVVLTRSAPCGELDPAGPLPAGGLFPVPQRSRTCPGLAPVSEGSFQ